MDFPYTDTAIQPISGNYISLVSIYRFTDIQTRAGSTNREVKAIIIQNTATDYTIRVYSDGYYINKLSVQGLLIDSAMVNNPRLKQVILILTYQYNGPTGTTTIPILSYPGVAFPWSSSFFSIYHFTAVDKLNYELYVDSSSVTQLIKYSNTNSVSLYTLVFYKNKCNDPFFLDLSSILCVSCPERCLKCNSLECFSCADGFTMSSDKTFCECNFTIIANFCYDFTSGPLKGCVSAIKNSTGVLCMACSTSLFLVAKNYECTCKDGFKFDANGKCFEYCGDGMTESHQCDDRNQLDGDGCSSSCTLERGFKCTVTAILTTC
jgi:cysteine-rich repeat protein